MCHDGEYLRAALKAGGGTSEIPGRLDLAHLAQFLGAEDKMVHL